MVRLDGIGRESERVELKGESFKKNINFAYDTEDQQRTERVCSGIGERVSTGICRSSEFRRKLYGIYTDVFWGLRERKKSLKEIFNEIWPLVRNNNL